MSFKKGQKWGMKMNETVAHGTDVQTKGIKRDVKILVFNNDRSKVHEAKVCHLMFCAYFL